jgi:polysaccharide deacetylase family protein (PEP-CTERM system associated)
MTTISASPIVNALTVDVEDYFQVSAFEGVVSRDRWGEYQGRVVANTERLLGILRETKVHATFFVLGWTADRYPDLVGRIIAEGHEIASHGHAHRLVYDMTPEDFRADLRQARAALEAAGAQGVVGYRAPSFSITERSLWALDVLIEEGFTWDASIFPIRHDRYGIPSAPRHPFRVSVGQGNMISVGRGGVTAVGQGFRLRNASADSPEPSAEAVSSARDTGNATPSLLEIPASTIRIGGMNLPIGGGGYFRLLPYAWTRWGIARVNHLERRSAVFYLHPWEVDPGQPRLAAGWRSRFRHYRNLDRTEERLQRLLGDFSFDTISAALLQPAVALQRGLALPVAPIRS